MSCLNAHRSGNGPLAFPLARRWSALGFSESGCWASYHVCPPAFRVCNFPLAISFNAAFPSSASARSLFRVEFWGSDRPDRNHGVRSGGSSYGRGRARFSRCRGGNYAAPRMPRIRGAASRGRRRSRSGARKGFRAIRWLRSRRNRSIPPRSIVRRRSPPPHDREGDCDTGAPGAEGEFDLLFACHGPELGRAVSWVAVIADGGKGIHMCRPYPRQSRQSERRRRFRRYRDRTSPSPSPTPPPAAMVCRRGEA